MGREDLELLTDREREVVGLIGRGKLPKEVASELGISGPTVSRCIERVGKKLGIHDRLGVLRFAVDVSGAERREIDLTILTPMEREILALVEAGYSNAQIADFRKCSRHTVANHIASLLRKTGCGSRRILASARRQ